jgi:ferritin-like metal-binding protein YciE
MGLFGSEQFDSLEDLLKHNLQDIYDAETRLINTLPKLRDKATSARLKQEFDHHVATSEAQRGRLEQVLEGLNFAAERETCPAMKGLIEEAGEMLNAKGDNDAIDAALIMSAQRITHYEIAAYGSARCQTAALGRENLADMLQKSLDEEKAFDGRLAELAVEVCNPKAAVARG